MPAPIKPSITRFQSDRSMIETTPEEELLEIKDKLLELNKKYFGDSDLLAREITRVTSEAREVLRRPATAVLRSGEIELVIATGESVKKPPKQFYVKALDNRVKQVITGASDNPTYIVRVGRYRMKCGCKYSELVSSRAWRNLLRYAREKRIRGLPGENMFSRYNLCKHTLATLAIGLANKVYSLNDPELVKTLQLGLFAFYLASSNGRIDEGIVEENLRVLAQRHRIRLTRASRRLKGNLKGK